MRLWSIQHPAAYENMRASGALRANEEYLIFGGHFKDAYLWMHEQMKKRIGPPPEGVIYPVWAWYQWEGQRKKPDMRSRARNYGDPGDIIVRLTLDVPDDQVLLSDFDGWHTVMNDAQIVAFFSDHQKTIRYSDDEELTRIFDYMNPYDDADPEDLATQATMWEIRREWVRKAEFFKVR